MERIETDQAFRHDAPVPKSGGRSLLRRSLSGDVGCVALKTMAFLLVAVVLSATTVAVRAQVTEGPLYDYVTKPDDSYHWKVRQKAKVAGVEVVELTLTSQTWRDIVWKHRLILFRPPQIETTQGLLLISGGGWKDEYERPPSKPGEGLPPESFVMANLVKKIKSPVALINQVPFQPIFDGMVEDQIISYTFERFLETGDPQWPLLLPMTKAAVRAMDATQEYAKKRWGADIQHFTVTGGSKRGWTTWMTGAVDSRANAIAPIVIDVLNMPVQMKHQLDAWGEYSEQIADYTRRGIQFKSNSPRGVELNSIVDPYSYRAVLVQPKLIIIGTNDRYWPLDALNIYWDDLHGEKYILYVPNNGHGVKDLKRVVGGVAALHRHAAGQLTLPKLTWKLAESDGHLTLRVSSDQVPKQVSAWIATSPTRDFRGVKWEAKPAKKVGDHYEYTLPIPEDGYAALFGELEFDGQGMPYFLSTNVRIGEGPKAPKPQVAENK